VITHGHEDHVAALGWYLAKGFSGRILMTEETQRGADLCLASYATHEHRMLFRQANVERLPVNDGRATFHYCGDVVPASPVFAMDPVLSCNAIALDASYGDDDTSRRERSAQIREWIAARPPGCVLPTPLYGRSVELLAIIPGRVALAPGMGAALRTQIAAGAWLVADTADLLAARLDAASEWQEGTALPRAALLCHDGMGLSGPSRNILETALAQGHATLFTGYLPTHSPGERMVSDGHAAWIRLPTHPTQRNALKWENWTRGST